MPLTLTYFQAAGRAASIRLMFHIGNVEFVDKQITKEEWPALKPSMPFGQVPVLELDCGTKIPQGMAILEFAARKAGWHETCPVTAAKVESVINTIDDIWAVMGMYWRSPEDQQAKIKDQIREKFIDLVKKLDAYVAKMEKDGYAVGNGKDTVADLLIFDSLYQPNPQIPMPFDKTALFRENAPTLKKIADRFKKTHQTAIAKVQPAYAETL